MLDPKLKELTVKIRDRDLRKRTLKLLEDPTLRINEKEYSGLSFDVSPAGLSQHHCYRGGYIEHVVSTNKIALAMCDCVESVYHGKVNRDLVLAGVLLHDVFKPVTYAINENGNYDSTRLADYLDHLSLATSELLRRDFPLELIHIVAAHHGNYGPTRPRTIEALICHLADLADSRLNGEVLGAATYLMRRTAGQELSRLNAKEAFEIVHSKTTEGWEGVAKSIERMKRKRKSHKA